MSTHIRVLQGFKRMTDQQVVNTTGAVLHGLAGNDAFPNPPAELKMLATAFEELNTAFAAQAHGGAAATADKNNKRDVVITLLRKLAHYVQDNCEMTLRRSSPAAFKPCKPDSAVRRFPSRLHRLSRSHGA